MFQAIQWFRDALLDISNLLDSYTFTIAGMSISLFELLLGFFALSVIISVFWKGGRG